MKTKIVLLYFLFSFSLVLGQGEAAMPTLWQQPVSPLIGKGMTGVSNMERDPVSFYYNPATLANFDEENFFSFMLMPEKTEWGVFPGIEYFSSGVSAGINLKNYLNGFPLRLGIGFVRSGFDFGDFYVTTPDSPDGFKTNSKDVSNSFGVGIGVDYILKFNLGFTAKHWNSDLGERFFNGTLRRIEADGFAFDFGAFVHAPLVKLFFNDYEIQFDNNSFIKPKVDVSLGYSLLNVGGKVDYEYLEGDDPLPRNARIGYSINLGFDTDLSGTQLNLITYGFSAEADDILIKTREFNYWEENYSYSNVQTEYENIFGKINIGKHLIGLEEDRDVVVHKGHSLNLFETISINSGRYNGRGFPNYKTNSFTFSTQGIFKLLGRLIDDYTISWLTNHIVIKYSSINMFVDTAFETNLKGSSISINNISL